MPPRKKAEDDEKITNPCPGGLSFGRLRKRHNLGRVTDVLCYRCNKRMGCSRCCEPARHLVCLVCHDWATKAALKEHGRMVPREKRGEMMKILFMIYNGKVTEPEGQKLFDELMNL